MPPTRSGCLVVAAIEVTGSDEVLVAMMVSGLVERVELGEHLLLDVEPLENRPR